MTSRAILAFAVCLLLLCACRTGGQKPVPAFYYWRTSFDRHDTVSARLIQRLGVGHFYIRYMDVDLVAGATQPVSVGVIDAGTGNAGPFTTPGFTPVVYITNRVFEGITDAGADSLAVNVAGAVGAITAKLTGKPAFNELQIDCDWTKLTKNRYFRFLHKLRQLDTTRRLSATIRLYPYKYPEKMGVPPVHRGMLMCYNQGAVTSPGTDNSVFDLAGARLYLTARAYPIPLDAVLPVFGWYVWFSSGQYRGIIHDRDIVRGHAGIFPASGAGRFRCTADTVIGNRYFREGDELRAEFPAGEDLVTAASLLRQKLGGQPRIAFFEWNNQSVVQYEKVIGRIYPD